MKMTAKAMALIQKGMPSRLSPSLPAAIIWLRPTASMTMVRMMQLTVRACTPKNFSMMPGTVPVSRERKSLAKSRPRNRTPMPLAMVYHQPERPYRKPYSLTPVVAVPPSHSPVDAQTMAKVERATPVKAAALLVFRPERTPINTVRIKYTMIMIS